MKLSDLTAYAKEKYNILYDYLDNLPEPKTTEEIALMAFSDAIDDISIMLTEYRMKNNMNQSQLAEKIGLSQSMISAYESGARNISLEKLCYLMAGIGEKVSLHFEKAKTNDEEIPGTSLFPADPNPKTEFNIA